LRVLEQQSRAGAFAHQLVALVEAAVRPGDDARSRPRLAFAYCDAFAFTAERVADTTLGTLVANLGYDKLVFPNPVFVGDTLRSESECIAVRESKSRPNAGIVTWAHRSFNQRGELVCECTRTALLLKNPQ
jgi:hypothetical protein